MNLLKKFVPAIAVLVVLAPMSAMAHDTHDQWKKHDLFYNAPSTHHWYDKDGWNHHHYRDGYGHKLNERQDRQWSRIDQGIHSGELTRGEVRVLKDQQRDIARLEDMFKSDGRLSQSERQVLNEKQNSASDSIYRLKHNERERVSDNYGGHHH